MTTTRTTERKQFLADIFTTALEGGIGYWSEASAYHWRGDPDVSMSDPAAYDLDGFYAVIVEGEDDGVDREGDCTHRIDQAVIVRGVNRIMNAKAPYYDPNGAGTNCAEVPYLTRYVAQTVRQASHDNDASEIDASLADDIVQVGLFGEVRYG